MEIIRLTYDQKLLNQLKNCSLKPSTFTPSPNSEIIGIHGSSVEL